MCRNKSLVDNKKVIIVLIRMMEEGKEHMDYVNAFW